MNHNDLMISRAAAIDALTDENIEMNFDSVYDGEIHRTKRAAIRIVANLPTVDAIPLEWLREKMLHGEPDESKTAWRTLKMWEREQEAR